LGGQAPTRDDLARARAARVVKSDDHVLRFSHPLVRSAIVQDQPPPRIREAHAALSTVYADDPDRSIWHQALSLAGKNEEISKQLEVAAGRALRRGAHAVAAGALEQAARLSDDSAHTGELLFRAGSIQTGLGDREQAERLWTHALEFDLPDLDRAIIPAAL